MSNRYIYIFIEVARRELDSRMALAVQLAKKGYNVIAGEKNQILWNMFAGKYPPGVILDKCAQIAAVPRFELLMKKGFIYTVLDEEGLITNASYFNNQRFSKQAEKFVAANFVVGKYLDKIILSEYKNANNIISGNLRYSMLHPEWKYWFEDEYSQIRKKYGSFVLLVSSFNPYPQAYKIALPGMKETDDYLKSEMKKYIAENRGKGLNFVLRPHPSDQPYDYDNVQIDGRFNIIPWIMAAEYIVNAKCTTSLEAVIAGKRAYTWKFPTRVTAYKLANLFADNINEIGTPVLPSCQARRTKILSNLLSYSDSVDAPTKIIIEAIEKLAFPECKTKSKYSVHKLMHLKNSIRFYLRGDNYRGITQKFMMDDIQYAYRKISKYDLSLQIDGKVLEINC